MSIFPKPSIISIIPKPTIVHQQFLSPPLFSSVPPYPTYISIRVIDILILVFLAMVDSISLDQSLLFPKMSEAPQELPSFSESLLFSNDSQSQPVTLQTSSPNVPCSTEFNHKPTANRLQSAPPPKTAKLFDGSTVTLRPRTKQPPIVDFSDVGSILDMDMLHERVKKRELIENSKKTLSEVVKKKKSTGNPQIWADKYKPHSFMDLCSAGNERQYRQILQFLRKWNTLTQNQSTVEDDYVDNLGRPLKKVLLVHGASGSGKTTIVHLLARQMGYAVQELNAANSMDTMHGVEASEGASRFANATAALKLKIKNAMTSNMLDLTKNENDPTSESKIRPTCLVIDEIDSSINASDIVKVISDLVAADSRSLGGKKDVNDTKNKKKKPFVLRRPIICIANNIYSQNTRNYGPNPMDKLRPICELVAFRRPVTSGSRSGRISLSAQRSVKELLSKVNTREKLGLDHKDISEVFEVCEGDIRACLNYMQFTSRKLDPQLYAFLPSMSGKGNTAHKDESLSWFGVVDQLFQRDLRLSKDDNFEIMLDMMVSGEGKSASSGSLDKIMRGCFNKYLDIVHLQDDSVVRPAEISDWMYYYDLLNSSVRDSFFYPALTALKFWSLFSDIHPRKINDENSIMPNARGMDFEAMELMKQNKSIVKRLGDQMPLTLKVALSGSSSSSEFYACQFVPFLDTILSPDIGSAKVKSSLSAFEKSSVEKLAQLVSRLDIKLETSRDTDTNQTSLSFAPNWDTITIFETPLAPQPTTSRAKTLYSKRLWLFPMLQTELESAIATGLKKRAKSENPQEKETSKAKRTRITSSVDYFKNQYDMISTQLETPSKPLDHDTSRIWVKYHEGFSNAVRKNIGWADLWAA